MTATLTHPRPATATVAAAIYHGTVAHRRCAPVEREFTPRLFLAYVDVDALPESLDAIPCWSARHAAPVHFRRRDFLDGGTQPLGDAVRDLVEERLGNRPSGSIFLLAHLRTFGQLFNPLAVYYCWAPNGHELDAIVLEVTNTPWGERQWYVLDAREGRATAWAPKRMHVSPFLPMDVEYRVTWTVPGPELRLGIEVERAGSPIFEARLALRRVTLDRRRAIALPVRNPLMPLRGWIAIYRQALRLFIARVPLYRHPAPRPRSGAR
jgi:DUF1365 family protein